MAEKNLKQKATSGVIWTALQKYSTIFIRFISGIILARLLTPYDYGCIGMLAIFMTLAEAFIDGGFGSALIQKKRPTQEDYSTIFYWNLGMAVIMYAILFVCAPAISRFYKIPLLCDVLRVQGLVLFIYAFNVVQRNQLRKNLNFKVLSIVTIATSIIALGVTIYMAYKGFGVWALVAQNLITAAIPAIVFWFYIKWRPIRVFSWKSFKELFSFGFYMFLTHLLNNFSIKIQGLLIGKIYSPVTMGYYSKAHSTESLASESVSSIMTQVTYPLYAEAQNDLKQLANMIRRVTTTIAYITFPLLFILLLLAKPIFILLYSERWLASVPYFQVLCIAGMGISLTAVNTQAIAAIGKSKLMFVWTVVKRTIGLAAIVGGLFWFGMKGLLVGVVFSNWFSYFVNICLVSKHVGYHFWNQIRDLIPVTLASVIAAAIAYGVGYLLHLNLYMDGLVKLVVYVAVYLGWSFAFKPEAYSYFLSVMPKKFKFMKRFNKK
ncbi:MAG: lipopolysaccharide biosynthesis protein [Bacteroidales bacterium]|nr:lipopolysaccharide biosynthesis protein [Bacteroidales bacterium]